MLRSILILANWLDLNHAFPSAGDQQVVVEQKIKNHSLENLCDYVMRNIGYKSKNYELIEN